MPVSGAVRTSMTRSCLPHTTSVGTVTFLASLHSEWLPGTNDWMKEAIRPR